jgi:hypothetical protein
VHLEEVGAVGILTVAGDGRCGDGARPTTSFNDDDYLSSTARGSGQGETKTVAALYMVGSG